MFCSLLLATELLLDAGRGAAQVGDGEVSLVQLTGQLGHLLPHAFHLSAVSLPGSQKLLSELQNEFKQLVS